MKKTLTSTLVALLCSTSLIADAAPVKISDEIVKIGLILDMSSLYADVTGPGTVTAAQLAIADFGGKVLGKPIQLVFADHQNKADIAATKAREWFDRDQVDAILDVAASGPAIAVAQVAKEKNRIAVFSGMACKDVAYWWICGAASGRLAS